MRLSSPLLALAILALVPGCAQERKPINRVQADALDKTFFVGKLDDPTDDPEFYWRNFVIDGSEAQELIGIGSWSAVDRIRWEITENTLFARRAYSQSGGDDKGAPGRIADGTVVAAYAIEDHFDIRRDYNPQTGEQLNVIEENTTDRPWYERGHMRVDWSLNLVDTPLWQEMFAGKVFGDIEITPEAYYVNDPTSDDAPHFEVEEGYFDVTSKFLVAPRPTSSPFSDVIGDIPACLLMGIFTGSALFNCDPQEAVVRSSYLRVDQVDPDGDFEPFENSTAQTDIFGNPGGLGTSFSVGVTPPPRLEWDPGYGYVDPNLKRLMQIHDIWEQSHQTRGECTEDSECRDLTGRSGSVCLPSGTCTIPCSYEARGDEDNNGTDDQCENTDTHYRGKDGAQCSLRDRCTIPYRDREVEPIGYWVNADMPDSLLDRVDSNGKVTAQGATEEIGATWDQALRFTVAKTREVECRRVGKSREACHAQFFEPGAIEMIHMGGWGIDKPKDDSPVLVICHNPVRDYDHELCGEPGYEARVGDLRHNLLLYWPYSSRVPWGGIGNWSGDPLTGQIIGASATTMGRSVTYAAAEVRDVLMVANGELDMTDITDGVPAIRYQRRLKGLEAPSGVSLDEIRERVASVDASHAADAFGLTVSREDASLERYRELKASVLADPSFAASAALDYDAVLDKLRGSVFEAQMVDPSWMVDAVGLSPSTPIDEATLDQASPLRGRDYGKVEIINRMINQRLGERGICHMAGLQGVGNPDIRGLARYFADQFSNDEIVRRFDEYTGDSSQAELSKKRADLIYEALIPEIYKGIELHEMGHSLGLLHNFASSYDSVNYVPQYWQLRTQEGQALGSCNGQPRTGDTFPSERDSCMGPRYLDPETDDELGQKDESRPGINYFGHTSTMEYQHTRFFETIGLGQYDLMAMNALYGRILQTFDADAADGLTRDAQNDFAGLHFSQLIDENYVNWEGDAGLSGVTPMHYTELARRLKLYDPGRCRDATDEEAAQAKWRLVHGKVCTPPPKDFGAWQDFQDRTSPPLAIDGTRVEVRGDARAAAGNLRWPYRYGVTFNAYPHTNPFDAGADVYEVTHQSIEKFEYEYPFRYFRRQRRDWYYPALPSRLASSFYERLRAIHWGIAFGNATNAQLYPDSLDRIEQSDNWQRPYLMAETEMLDGIARAFLMPQPGSYSAAGDFSEQRQRYTIYDTGGSQQIGGLFSLDASTARYVDPQYDSGPLGGGSWNYLDYAQYNGFNVEKADAARALTDGRPVFLIINRDRYLDSRNTNINFRTDMPKAIDRILGGVLSNDWEAIGPYVTPGDQHPEPRLMSFGADVPTRPEGARVLFPNIGYNQQVAALVWAHVLARLNSDLTLSNKMRVWVKGRVGELDIPEAQQARFYDPRSGITYVARAYGLEEIDGSMVDRGIGSRMIQHANTLLGRVYAVETDDSGEMLYDEFGSPVLSLDDSGSPIESGDDEAKQELRDYVGLLDATVQIAELVGYGPFNSLGAAIRQ